MESERARERDERERRKRETKERRKRERDERERRKRKRPFDIPGKGEPPREESGEPSGDAFSELRPPSDASVTLAHPTIPC
jgi:hypothetical protein